MNELIESLDSATRAGLDQIRVIGLGGCGCNTISHLVNYGLKGPKLIAANSDQQALDKCNSANKIILGPKCTKGTGCGGIPARGRDATLESIDVVLNELSGAKVVFITAGMGGGTGTGAAPVVAEALSKLADPPVIVSVILLPFGFEKKRLAVGKATLRELSKYCHNVIPVYNDNFIKCFPKAKVIDCLKMADDVLLRAVVSVTDLIEFPGYVNLDMRDIRTALSFKGKAIMGCGEASGVDREKHALHQAITSPLMSEVAMVAPKALLVNVTGDRDMLISEFEYINGSMTESTDIDCEVFVGMAFDDRLKESGTLKVTVIATGLPLDDEEEQQEVKSADGLKKSQNLNFEAPIIVSMEPEIDIAVAPETGELESVNAKSQESIGQQVRAPYGRAQVERPVQKRLIRLSPGVNRNSPGLAKSPDGLQGAGKYGGSNYDEPSFMRNRKD
ncbi:MAG: cell division FtsZ family protein [Deltaproteobacteria bacterium]|jgi:cell division protein FtsZ|nr:cell division FtsZ family protein [Deltaproteobacteria bacterium]